MLLKYYLAGPTGKISSNNPRLQHLAAQCAVSPRYLYMVTLGHKQPGWRLCQLIETETEGLVSCQDLRPDIYSTV